MLLTALSYTQNLKKAAGAVVVVNCKISYFCIFLSVLWFRNFNAKSNGNCKILSAAVAGWLTRTVVTTWQLLAK